MENKYLFLLSGENINLAQQEVKAITNQTQSKLYKNLLLIQTNNIQNISRLAYTKKVYKVLFTSTLKNIKKDLENFNWQSIYKKDFSLRIHNQNLKEKELAGYIWDKVKSPKVNLKSAKTQIELFTNKKQIFCALLIHKPNSDFQKRHPNLRPFRHPTTLKPKLARAMLNLSKITKGKLLDPFCGTGGILIEAGILNYIPIGYDLSKEMLIECEKNLKFYKIKNYKLKRKDATGKLQKSNIIVTDPPYGRASKLFKKEKQTITDLYKNFLLSAQNSTNTIVIIFPNSVKYKPIIKKTKFKITRLIKIRVHRTLQRHILILNK